MSEKVLMLVNRQGERMGTLEEAVFEGCTWRLNDSGELKWSISPIAPMAAAILPWATEIQLWVDGYLRWQGIPLAATGGPQRLSWTAEGVLSWLKKRYIDITTLVFGDATHRDGSGTLVPLTVEQFDIIQGLIDYAQDETPGDGAQANRNLRILAAPIEGSGIVRTAQYKRDEHKVIYDCIKEFPTMFQGCDFDIDLDPGSEFRFFHPYFPEKGTLRPEFRMEFNEDVATRNMNTFGFSIDGQNMTNDVFYTGASVEGQKIEERYEDEGLAVLFGVLQSVISGGNILDRPWLHDHAHDEVTARGTPIQTYQVTSATTQEGDLSMFGQDDPLETGDYIPVVIDYGAIQVNEYRRVNAITLNPNDSLTVEFGKVYVP